MAGYAWDATRSQSHFHSEKNDEEMDFFTELALHETQRWIEVSFLFFFQNSSKCKQAPEIAIIGPLLFQCN